MRLLLACLLSFALPGIAFGLPVGELRRLAAYEAYLVATAVPPVPDMPCRPRPGKCEECNGTGKVGDGTVFVPCGNCGGTGRVGESSAAPPPACKPKPVAPPNLVPQGPTVIELAPQTTRNPGPRWNVEGRNSYSTQELADHLRRVHGVNIDGKTRSELEALHDNLHNSEVRSSGPVMRSCPSGNCPTQSTQSCPGGNCPTQSTQSYQYFPRRGLLRR